MTGGFFSADTQVLLANGTYKNVSLLKPDDYVLNMNKKAVKVKKVLQGPAIGMTELQYSNWYSSFHCTRELEILIKDSSPKKEEDDTIWTLADKLVTDNILSLGDYPYALKLPNEFNIPIITPKKIAILTPTYHLGLIFGLYAGYGSIVNDSVEFRFGPNDELVKNVSEFLTDQFDAETFIEKDEHCYKVHSNSAHLLDFFSEFKSKLYRTIPNKYWSSKEDYVHGLFDGLIEFDPKTMVSRYISVTKEMAEIFLWICSILKQDLESAVATLDQSQMQVYSLFVNHAQQTSTDITVIENSEQIFETWSIIVDCPTNSYIVNNLIVRSKPVPEKVSEEGPTG